ncbi:MAG: response regulator [Planctomycetia bacterium]|nr:response regulator [Planctomycetia bacterium]
MTKILMIDDDLDALQVARSRLAKLGLAILSADGGIAGLEAARREMPDVILLDQEMPDLSGFDVCRVLKADAELCMIPVLFLSASNAAEDKIKGLDLGAVDYIVKPFDASELCARVRAALRTKRIQDLLMERAHVDPVTGRTNHPALLRRLQREWDHMQHNLGRVSFAMADINHFRLAADAEGCHIGDELLQEVTLAMGRPGNGRIPPEGRANETP